MKKKILVADDDEDLAYVVSESLASAGFETEATHDGIGTFEKAKQWHPDLVILDWQMPTGRGPAVLEMLAEEKATQTIPVLILSGVSEPGMDHTALALGVCGILRKPCDPRELVSKVREILAKKELSK